MSSPIRRTPRIPRRRTAQYARSVRPTSTKKALTSAGPRRLQESSRIGRVDLRDPAHPTLALSLDVDGNFAGFAYDGSSRYLLEIKGNDGSGADRAVVYLENQGRLTLTTEGTMMPSFGNVSRFFARDGHAYLLEGGLSIYRLP